MLADELAEAVAQEVLAVSVSVNWLRRALALVGFRLGRPGNGPDLLHRANADAVRLPQRPVHRPGLGHPHLRAADEVGGVGGIGVAVANEPLAGPGLENDRSEHPAGIGWIGGFQDRPDMHARAVASFGKPQ